MWVYASKCVHVMVCAHERVFERQSRKHKEWEPLIYIKQKKGQQHDNGSQNKISYGSFATNCLHKRCPEDSRSFAR